MATDKCRPEGSRAARLTLLAVVYALSASFALYEFIHWPGLGPVERGAPGSSFFGDMVYARAARPYVTRVLVPVLVRGAVQIVPEPTRCEVADWTRRTFAPGGRPAWLADFPFEFAVTGVLLFFSLLLFAFALRGLARAAAGFEGIEQDLVPAVALLWLPSFYGYVSHVYDLPALALFTLGLYLIARQRLVPFRSVFAVATVNKETALLLVFVWALWSWRRTPGRSFARDLVLQLGVWVVVRGAIMWVFRHNAGSFVEFHFTRNLAALATPLGYFLFRPVAGFLPFPTGLNVLQLAGLAWVLAALGKAAPFLRCAFWVIVPLAIGGMLCCNVGELRDYYEFYPIALLIVAGSLYRLAGYRSA
jgi:hypothetical protein